MRLIRATDGLERVKKEIRIDIRGMQESLDTEIRRRKKEKSEMVKQEIYIRQLISIK